METHGFEEEEETRGCDVFLWCWVSFIWKLAFLNLEEEKIVIKQKHSYTNRPGLVR